jgi:hypothetical protein
MNDKPSFTIIDSASDPGGICNDDCWGSTASAVWVLDGATGLSKERLFPAAPSDAQWFVTAVDNALRGADWSMPTKLVLQNALQGVLDRLRREAIRPLERMSMWPSASFVLARVDSDFIEFVNLGDCRILWKSSVTGAVNSFGWSRVTELDASVVKEIQRLHSEGETSNDVVWRTIVPMIEANRRLRNAPGGYWIMDATGTGLEHLQFSRVKASEIESILLCTDGYYRLVDTYGKRNDRTLLDDSYTGGVRRAIQEIRDIERADTQCVMYPRIKASDDATGVMASV